MRYDTVIFDLDVTLLDTLDDLTDGVNHALREFGFPEASRDEIRARLGYEMCIRDRPKYWIKAAPP